MAIEDDFYATIKLNSGEEIFAKVAASEEEDRTMLIVHSPVTVLEIKNKTGLLGLFLNIFSKFSLASCTFDI